MVLFLGLPIMMINWDNYQYYNFNVTKCAHVCGEGPSNKVFKRVEICYFFIPNKRLRSTPES